LGENFAEFRSRGSLQNLSVAAWVGILQNDVIFAKGGFNGN
jgi:hypothetical protein